MNSTLKQTPLTRIHKELGAKMVEYAGFDMPVQYEGVKIEHQTVRESVGVFDVSHMGEFVLKGKCALDLIQSVCSNDASKLVQGKAQYSCMPNDKGGIVDDLIVYMIAENHYMLVVNAANIQKDWDWINKHNAQFGVQITDNSDKMALLAVQGPKAQKVVQRLTSVDLDQISYYHFKVAELASVEKVIISATGYTGSGGFELYVPNERVEYIWEMLFKHGKEEGIKPIGLAARDTLRLEMGYCLYGNDIDDTTSPLEAGLGWITKFTKSFVNSDALQKQKQVGVERKLVGFKIQGKGIARNGYEIVDNQDQVIGRVTSGTMSPSLEQAIGLGYVDKGHWIVGSEIGIKVRNKVVKATICSLPFYKK